MKKLLILILIYNLSLFVYAGKVTVINSGHTFSQVSVNINVGDTVVFQLEESHNAVEVSQATYNANGNTSNGGFSVPFGGGTVKFSQPGTYYYVCEPHASMGMKGVIVVSQVSGVKTLSAIPDLEIYPKFSPELISFSYMVKGKSKVQYVLSNLSGQVVSKKSVYYYSSGKINENLQLVRRLSTGVYVLSVYSSDGRNSTVKLRIK